MGLRGRIILCEALAHDDFSFDEGTGLRKRLCVVEGSRRTGLESLRSRLPDVRRWQINRVPVRKIAGDDSLGNYKEQGEQQDLSGDQGGTQRPMDE